MTATPPAALGAAPAGGVAVIGDRYGSLTLGAAALHGATAIRTHQDALIGERALADERVLMRPDRRRTVQRCGPEGEGSVAVTDDGHPAGRRTRDRGRRLVEDQPVARVGGEQVRRLDVGVPAQS